MVVLPVVLPFALVKGEVVIAVVFPLPPAVAPEPEALAVPLVPEPADASASGEMLEGSSP